MTTQYKSISHIALFCTVLAWALVVQSKEPAHSEAEFMQFLKNWPGTYNNSQQVTEQVSSRLDEEDLNVHLHLNIRRVDLPEFGEHTYYAEWQEFEPPHNVFRQRIYSFVNDGDFLRLDLHIFPFDAEFIERTEGAYADPSRLNGVTPDDMYQLAGCSVYFSFEDERFVGAMKKQSCSFPAPDSGEEIYSWSQMQLEEDSFRYLDGWFRTIDDTIYNYISTDWYVFKKQVE